MEVGDTIYSAEEFEELPNGTVVQGERQLWGGRLYGQLQRADKSGFHRPSLVHLFGTEMSDTTETFEYPAKIIQLGDE